MNLDSIIQEVLILAGTFNLKLVIFLFLVCSIGEFGLFSIPYLLETVWLLSGYNLITGALSPLHLVLLWCVAQAGRQTGAVVLYYLGRFGIVPLEKLYRRYFEASLSERLANNNSLPLRLFRRMNHLSSFSVALGRLLGLRIPLTLTLGAKRQFTPLLFGVMLSSLAWDGIYISLGIAGGQAVLEPAEMLLYSLVGLTLLYVITFGVRYLKRRLSRGSVNYISGVR